MSNIRASTRYASALLGVAVERNELRIVGTKFFSVKGSSRRYIDATYPVRVDVVKEKR